MLKNQGGDDADFEECRRHVELIINMCKEIRESSHYEVRKVFSSAGEQLEDQVPARGTNHRLDQEEGRSLLAHHQTASR